MIYADPSELSARQFPIACNRHCTTLPHLETLTGGDILVTAYTDPIGDLSDEDDPEPERQLKRACADGNLIQRKHGADLTSSIKDKRLFHAGMRMTRWTWPGRPWLLVIGSIGSKKSKATIGGKATGLGYNAVIGALDWWSDPHGSCGGVVTVLHDKALLENWLTRMDSRLKKQIEERDQSNAALPDDSPAYRPPDKTYYEPEWAWLQTLETLPGIGPKRAVLLGKHFGDLATTLHWMSRPDLFKDSREHYPKGASLLMTIKIRKWLGLAGNRNLFDTLTE